MMALAMGSPGMLSGGSAAADEPGYRNLALRRAAYHSSAANYNDTGHLVTDGIITGAGSWQVAVSDQHADNPSGEGVACAFDGTTASKWLTFHDKAWLQLHFPKEEAYAAASYTVASANDEANRDPKAWTLQGSNDGEKFVDLDSRSGEDFTERYQVKRYTIPSPAAYRYYRLNITQNHGDNRTQLSEWDLQDVDGKSLVRPFGDVFSSVWNSASAKEEWVYVDLGGKSRIDKAKLYWANENYASKYSIQISEDAKTWRTVLTEENGEGGVEEKVFEACDAVYVRLLCQAGVGACYALSELEIYGTNDVRYTLPAMPAAEADGTQYLTGGNWRVQRASEVDAAGEQLAADGYDDSTWLPATVPGTVLTSYRNAGAIPDPNVADQQLQISDSFFTTNFWYRNTFVIPASKRGERTWLNFDSINWKADVYFNGEALGSIEGAFIRGKFDVTELVNYGGENDLAVYIHMNDTPGTVTVQTKDDAGPNGGILGADNPTIHASIGWDWVPTIRGRNVGIYGDVFLSYTQEVQLLDPWIVTELDVENRDFSKAKLTVKSALSNPSDQAVTTVVSGAVDPSGLSFESEPVTLAAGETKEVTLAVLEMKNPTLWWPNTYGDQFLYTAKLTAKVDGAVSDEKRFRFGVRQFTYQTTSPMTIYCNGTRIVCRGGNWGMDDSNLAATPEDYDIKIRLHAEANLTMIRNWVGMTNHRAFYEACDKYGVLVWDDFWLANPGDGPNPDDEDMFMANAADKVRRNRYHAALALYCGRNEGDPPATINDGLAALTESADGTRHYIPHSASGTVSGFGPYGVQSPKWYFMNTPKTLHSERGMPNIPSYESLLEMLTEKYAWPINPVWGLHDFCGKSAMQADNFESVMKTCYGEYNSLSEFARIAQMVNYENHKAMFEAVYTNRGNGMLMWMSQSAWPSMVWQTYDYYYDTNAGYFAIKKANQPVNAIWNAANDQVVLNNATPDAQESLTVKLAVFDLNGRTIHQDEATISVEPDTATALMSVPDLKDATDIRFIQTRVLDKNGRQIADDFYWTNETTYQNYQALNNMEKVALTTSYRPLASEDSACRYEVTIRNESDTPALMIRLKTNEAKNGDRVLPVYYEDNYFSLMPGERKTVTLEFAEKYLSGGETALSVEGWNIEKAAITDITPDQPDEGLPGDVNGDEKVDTTDARLALQHAVGKIELDAEQQARADVSGDDKVDTTDARLILQKAVGKIDRFPVEN